MKVVCRDDSITHPAIFLAKQIIVKKIWQLSSVLAYFYQPQMDRQLLSYKLMGNVHLEKLSITEWT